MKPLVIYHANCWDGFCAAWIARKALGDIEAFPGFYGASPPDVTGRDVFLLDFSYKRTVMRQLLGSAHFVTVLDHHKTAEAELGGIIDEFIQRPDLIATDLVANPKGCELPRVHFDMSKSGGRLAWEHFAYLGGWQGMKAPWLVDYTEDRDLWRHALPDTHEINAALRSYPLDFDLWDEFSNAVGQREMFKREGAAIRRAEKAIVDTHVKNARLESFSLVVGGPSAADEMRVPIVNATVLFSEIAGELAKGHPFAACYFDRQDGKRQWSLRSTDEGVDVSAIAKAHGGGGHAHAAGFEQDIHCSGDRSIPSRFASQKAARC
jgi:oligoribonuclease NrnB/cAMP/cGMP phosphodiesterase (DHH superfamily)